MRETAWSIEEWRRATFGPPQGSNARMAARANEELAELLAVLTEDDESPRAAEELADVLIVLAGLAMRLGLDVTIEGGIIDAKMAVNRARRWELTGASGHGRHVPEAAPAAQEVRAP